MRQLMFLSLALPLLGGCVARTLVDVASTPVKVASKAVDLATTSQSEADQKRGRELRQREERYGRLEREWRKQDGLCAKGDVEACSARDAIVRELDALRPTIPAEPD